MVILLYFVALILSLLFIGKAAQTAIIHLIHIAKHLSWSNFVVSFLILGIATSIPEFLIGLNSSIDGTPQLSLGNLIGATIVLFTLVVGSTALISGKLKFDSNFTNKDLYITNFVLLLPLALFYDSIFSRLDAVIVLIAYAVYIVRVYKDRHKLSAPERDNYINGKLLLHIGYFAGAFVVVALASKVAVDSAVYIAELLKIPVLLVGALVFSIGTNFPELAVALSALKKHNSSLVGGNVLGSATTNSLIIALVALLKPITVYETDLFLVTIFFFTISVLIFSYFVKSKSEISRLEGFLLISLYSFFLIFELITKLL